KIPEIGGKGDEIVLTAWHMSAGAHVREGEPLAEVVTDKASFDIECPCDGTLTKVLKKQGDVLKINEVIAEISCSNKQRKE
ncbi:MAG TPA: lipoyl domain-containing protein, partial [Candidatus Omnitrophota bacterium]|nr:lipoyl domain-containing protein [Candidatus Omnitrophota bacterium]